MSSVQEPTAKPLATTPKSIEDAARDIIDGDRDATPAELVATFRVCINNHWVPEREAVLRALNAVQSREDNQ